MFLYILPTLMFVYVFTEESMTFKVLCIVLESVLESNKTLYPVYHQVMLASKLIIHF